MTNQPAKREPEKFNDIIKGIFAGVFEFAFILFLIALVFVGIVACLRYIGVVQ